MWHVANSKIRTKAVDKTLKTFINESKSVIIYEKNHGFHRNTEMGIFHGRRPISRKMSRLWNHELGWFLHIETDTSVNYTISSAGCKPVAELQIKQTNNEAFRKMSANIFQYIDNILIYRSPLVCVRCCKGTTCNTSHILEVVDISKYCQYIADIGTSVSDRHFRHRFFYIDIVSVTSEISVTVRYFIIPFPRF